LYSKLVFIGTGNSQRYSFKSSPQLIRLSVLER
jgi:hypothetical protein